jgi:hypothetical protein
MIIQKEQMMKSSKPAFHEGLSSGQKNPSAREKDPLFSIQLMKTVLWREDYCYLRLDPWRMTDAMYLSDSLTFFQT